MQIVLIGSSGAMGRSLVKYVDQQDDLEIYAGLQADPEKDELYPVFQDFPTLSQYIEGQVNKPDVIIDFSTAKLTEKLLEFALRHSLPIMLATTGQTDEQTLAIKQASASIPILDTHNTSIGVAVLQNTLIQLTKSLYPLGYDIEIIEKHHRYKIDAPSGTALMLKAAIESAIDEVVTTKFGREGVTGIRPHNEIVIHAVRGGDIVGEHTVIFANNQEVIEVQHLANSKELFVRGAIQCAKFIKGQPVGLYNMKDLMSQK